MTEEVVKKVKEYIVKQGLIRRGDKILLGLSGGADSVCLFYILTVLRKELAFDLRTVHVHHGIRPEAEEDVLYVEKLCEEEGIACKIFREDVPVYAEKYGLTEEEAGRKIRYRDFEKALQEWENENIYRGKTDRKPEEEKNSPNIENIRKEAGRYKIATAHHADDQAETVLFQLFRGSGLSGMRGILPMRGNIIRPLLCLSRRETEAFLTEKGISWREDRTNTLEEYSRNKIRLKILPYAEKEICSGAVRHIGKAAEILREAERYIRKQSQEAFRRVVKEEGEDFLVFRIPELLREDAFLQKQVILYGLEQITEARKDIGSVHVEEITGLLQKQGNGEIILPGGLSVRKSYQELFLSGRKDGILQDCLPTEKRHLFGQKEPEIKMEIFSLSDKEELSRRFLVSDSSEIMSCIPEKMYTKWFDYDKIETSPKLRHRQSGDFFTFDDGLHHKSVKQYMIEEKIPAMIRDKIWLVADGKHIMWIPGGRISTYYKVTGHTKTILQMEICEGK